MELHHIIIRSSYNPDTIYSGGNVEFGVEGHMPRAEAYF